MLYGVAIDLVGATLPEQLQRKLVKRGFEFTLIVVGIGH